MNPYAILVAVILWLLSAAGVGYWQHGEGRAAQKVADQVQFDRINDDITKQKAQADATYRAAQDANVKLMVERDQLKTKLEKMYATDQLATDAVRDKYAFVGLRFATSKSAGSGGGSGSATSTGPDASSPATSAVVELPRALASDLRQLALDADKLRDDYALCYRYLNEMK